MTYSNVLSTDIGRVRLLIPDKTEATAVFSDEEIAVLLELEDGVKRAAALALETIAGDEAKTMKVMRLMDLSTDGRATAQALLERAQKLRDQADLDDLSDEDTPGFDVVEWGVSDFARREIYGNDR